MNFECASSFTILLKLVNQAPYLDIDTPAFLLLPCEKKNTYMAD